MSLDGYIAGPNDEPDNPGGDASTRCTSGLHAGTYLVRPSEPAKELHDEMNAAGAVLLFAGGRRPFEELSSRVELEIVRVVDTPDATHMRYRIRR